MKRRSHPALRDIARGQRAWFAAGVVGAATLWVAGTSMVVAAPRQRAAQPPATHAASGPAQPPLAGQPEAGRQKADEERCSECHGATGQGDGHGAGIQFAKLAGQRGDYLVKQLQNYRDGTRKHDVMRLMTQRLDEADLRDIAAYFEAQAPMKGIGTGSETGRKLFAEGDSARHIDACIACHGEAGRGSPVGPVLAGQDARYLEQQLLDWRSAWRSNSPAGTMNRVTHSLNETEIRALADYLAAQSR